MILKHVKHALTEAGLAYFDQWFNDTVESLQQIPGFVCAHYVKIRLTDEKLHFFMFFEDKASLAKWAKSGMYARVLKRLQPYLKAPWQAQSYELK